jgi:ubiquinone/menaquinone biosynthesis C-methylase UbiE
MKTSTDFPTNPPVLRVFQSKDQTKAFYNKISAVYDLLSERSEAPMRKAGLTLLKTLSGEAVLEIGFGTGHCLASLAQAVGPSGKVLGLDLSDKMVKMAKTNLAKAGLAGRCQLRCGDATIRGGQHGCRVYELRAGTVRHPGNSVGIG